MKLSKNKLKRVYHSNKVKKIKDEILQDVLQTFSNRSEEQDKRDNARLISNLEMESIVYAKAKDEHPEIGTKIEEVTNNDLFSMVLSVFRIIYIW